jgi:hypothetical protein
LLRIEAAALAVRVDVENLVDGDTGGSHLVQGFELTTFGL